MERLKELAGLAALAILFSLLTWGLTVSYIEEYDFATTQPASATIVEKQGAKGLFMPPSYYVRVQLEDGEEANYLNRVSKSQMNSLAIGDEISGYSSRPADFSTMRDIIFDSLFFLFGILVFGTLAFCCFVAFVLSIPALERMEERAATKRRIKKRKKLRRKGKTLKMRQGWGIVGAVLFIFSIFIVRYLWNLLRKLLPIGKTETEALILDRTADVSYRKYEDSIYELVIAFNDRAGHNIQVKREVTRHTYNQYGFGDKLPITYRNANPYDVFIRDVSIWDLVQSLLYVEVYVYLVMIAVTIFVGWVFVKERRTEKNKG